MDQKEEFYAKLKGQLDDTGKWPGKYMYKFIVPSSGNSIAMVEEIFDNMGAVINTRPSKNGNYVSLTINVLMPSSQKIIDKYRQCEAVPGIISL